MPDFAFAVKMFIFSKDALDTPNCEAVSSHLALMLSLT